MAPGLEIRDISELHFDPENPRLPEALHHGDEEEVIDFFLLQCNLIELMMSISEKGYFYGEPLLVVPNNSEGGFTVVEGNRRLASLKILASDQDPPSMIKAVERVRSDARHRPTEVPCLHFERREDVLDYLGYRHITGIKEWDALAKARYLFQLRRNLKIDDHELAHKKLAKEIGSKSNAVAKILTGFNVLNYAKDEGILQELDLTVEQIPFSLLTTAIGWSDIAEFIGLDGPGDVDISKIDREKTRDLFMWSFVKENGVTTRVGDSRNFKILARIVQYPAAVEALQKGDSLATADVLAAGPLEALRVHINTATKAIESAQSIVTRVKGLQEIDVEAARNLQTLSKVLSASVSSLHQPEE
ncbi:ParB N-terminal domain-containing protein [Pseudophaeobacter sp. C1-32P7]|uniref:ParB N-terminal domain-containing protein n=1 Tax=Pseudophaeobacter sp. C1-32P7 TaxID=3098142 RepID=UPI0034D4C2C0